MSNKQGSEIPWWAIVLGFMFFQPIGFLLLFLSLGGVRIPTDQIRKELNNAAGQVRNEWNNAAQRRQTPSRTAWAGEPKVKKKKEKKNATLAKNRISGKLMTIFGSILSFAFATGLVTVVAAEGLGAEAFPIMGFLFAFLYLTGKGISLTRLSRRQRLYMGVIGQRKSIFLSDLAGAAGVSVKRATSDIQDMLADGILPMGYIDQASGRLVLTDQGYEPAPQPEPQPQEQSVQEDDDDALLRQIKDINDAIPGEEMSRKIDRIGEITKRILDYQRQNPAKAGELRQFLNYYLPTTLRLLKTYAQLDAQGVDGENISASKQRIEGMMDKVVEGFEKQLDQLFQTDAMDIATDVEVLERMLEKDGLGTGGLTMGG